MSTSRTLRSRSLRSSRLDPPEQLSLCARSPLPSRSLRRVTVSVAADFMPPWLTNDNDGFVLLASGFAAIVGVPCRDGIAGLALGTSDVVFAEKAIAPSC